MFSIHVERHLDLPGREVWALVDDFGRHHRFNPFIERSRSTNDIESGEGAEREIVLYDGSTLRQRIVDYQPGCSMIIEVVESGQWIRHHLTEITVTPTAEDACVLAYRVSFRPPLGWLGYPIGLLYQVILRSRYSQMMRGIRTYLLSHD